MAKPAFEIDKKALALELNRFNKGLVNSISIGLKRAVERGLVEIELAQIKGYLSNSNPAKPAGSTYVRTFKLRNSSRTKVSGSKFPRGVWDTDGSAPYDSLVLGTRSQQARIHRGRWRSQEDVIKIVDEKLTALDL